MVYAALALCLIPLLVLFICLALFVHDFKCSKGLWACALGLLAVIPCVLLHMFFIDSGGLPVLSLVAVLMEMLLVALIEESMKFAVMFAMPARKTSLLAFFSYSMLCGFSLACFETLVYILTGKINAGGLTFVWRLPTMLLHLACTGLAGLTVYSIRKKSVRILPFLFAVLFHGVYNYFELFGDDFRQYFAYVVVLIALFECRIQYANLKSKFEELSLVETDKSIKGDVIKMSEEKKSFWSKFKGVFAKSEDPVVEPSTPEQTVFGTAAEETIVDKVEETVNETVTEAVNEIHTAVEETRETLSFKNNYPSIDNLFNDDQDIGGSMSESIKPTSVELTEVADKAKTDAKKTATRAKAGAKKTAAKATAGAKKTAKAADKKATAAKKTVKKTATKAAKTTAKAAKTTAKKATTAAKKTAKTAEKKATTAKKAVKTTAKKATTAAKKATTAKKPAAKKTTAAKTTAKKPAAKKTAAKTTAKKPAAKKTTAKTTKKTAK